MWVALYILFLLAVVDARGLPVVDTNFGTVQGKWLYTSRNLSVAAYLGIPYANPPVGELRFQSPEPWTRKWKHVRNSSEDGPMCVQLERDGSVLGDEDCLNLNIFVPLIVNERKLPVLVFVHGGGFNVGSNNSSYFAPDYLGDQGIVLVTVNYRLGVFGFLSTATEQVPGNAGIKDILEALRWVNKNIEKFGGDPNVVSLVGQSAGAAAVHHLGLSKSTEGLFQSYITQSGTAVAPWAIHPPLHMRLKYLMVAKALGCVLEDKVNEFREYLSKVTSGEADPTAYNEDVEADKRIIYCMREASPRRIALTLTLFHVWKLNPWCNFGPTLEVNSNDPIISEHPLTAIKRGEFRDIPWITGLVTDEGLLKTIEVFRHRGLIDELEMNFEELGVYLVETQEVVNNASAFAEALDYFYFPPGRNIDSPMDLDRNLTRMTGDGLITWPSYQALKYQAEKMNATAYFYLFEYEGTFSSTYAQGIPLRYGVAHSDELNYLFPCFNTWYADLQLHNTERDWTMINIMTELWSNFVRSGIPSARMMPNWEPYQQDYRYMRIGHGRTPDIDMEPNFLPERMSFWEYLMGNMSEPMDKLFLENLEEEASELEEKRSTSNALVARMYFSGIQNILVFLIIYAVF